MEVEMPTVEEIVIGPTSLVYLDPHFAWFTTDPVNQLGLRWTEPYWQDNAGPPFPPPPHEYLIVVGWRGPFGFHTDESLSVVDFHLRTAPFLVSDAYNTPIWAGYDSGLFISTVREFGGEAQPLKVYEGV